MIIISLILSFFVIDYFAMKVDEILLPMAESKTIRIVTMMINVLCEEAIIGNIKMGYYENIDSVFICLVVILFM